MRGRSRFGWSQFIMGVCLVLLGVFTFLRPRSIFDGIAVVYGVAAVVTGICDIVIYIKEERFTGFGPVVSLVAGILSVMTDDLGILHNGGTCGCGIESPCLELLGRVGAKGLITCAAGAARMWRTPWARRRRRSWPSTRWWICWPAA